jgi:hypothetical protein
VELGFGAVTGGLPWLYWPTLTASLRQQALTVVLPVRAGEESRLERLLEDERAAVGAKLARVDSLHFARFAVIPQGGGTSQRGARLLFESHFDGVAGAHLTELQRELGDVFAATFERCEVAREGTAPSVEAALLAGSRRSAALFSAHPGRTARQIRDAARLRQAFRRFLADERGRLDGAPPLEIVRRARERLGSLAPAEGSGEPRPSVAKAAAALPRALRLVPLLLRAGLHDVADFLRALWTDEKLDRTGLDAQLARVAARYESTTQNAFLHVVELKPGRFRRRALSATLRHLDAWLRDGHALRRWDSCHSARWVELGDGRLLFSCHHDGSLEAELGTWVERLSFVGNLLWSHTRDFPPSLAAVFGGVRDERAFKDWARVKCLPTPIAFGAYPELSVADVARGAELCALFAGKLDAASARRALELV